MPVIINSPSVIEAAGNKPKIIEEYFGRVNSSTDEVSIAKMKSPQGWVEPGQRPAFNEYTLVLKGTLCVKTENELSDLLNQTYHSYFASDIKYAIEQWELYIRTIIVTNIKLIQLFQAAFKSVNHIVVVGV